MKWVKGFIRQRKYSVSAGARESFQIFDKIISATLRELTVARFWFCEVMVNEIRKSRNLKLNAMSKQTSAKFVTANEGLLYIKNF